MASHVYESDAEMLVRNPKELEEALALLRLHYENAAERGDHILLQIWSPQINLCHTPPVFKEDWKGYTAEM